MVDNQGQQPLLPEEVLEMFREAGAYLEGHFLLTSGLHSPVYLEKFQVLQHPDLTARLVAEFVRRFSQDNIQTVVGPVTGGMLLAYEMARQMGTRFVFTEREEGKMTLRRGFTLSPGERVVVVEDIATTGGSALEAVDTCRARGAEVVGVGVLVDRSPAGLEMGTRVESLLRLPTKAYRPETCPLCHDGIPFTKRGSRGLK